MKKLNLNKLMYARHYGAKHASDPREVLNALERKFDVVVGRPGGHFDFEMRCYSRNNSALRMTVLMGWFNEDWIYQPMPARA